MNYDTFKQKKKSIDNQQKELKKKSGDIQAKSRLLKKQKLQIKLDQFNKQKEETEKFIQKNMNKYVAGPSSF